MGIRNSEIIFSLERYMLLFGSWLSCTSPTHQTGVEQVSPSADPLGDHKVAGKPG
jgi:hypothetical protein